MFVLSVQTGGDALAGWPVVMGAVIVVMAVMVGHSVVQTHPHCSRPEQEGARMSVPGCVEVMAECHTGACPHTLEPSLPTGLNVIGIMQYHGKMM